MRLTPTLTTALATAAALALSACGGNSTDSDPESPTVADGEMADTGLPDAGAGAVAMEPQAFVDTMAASDRFELESARIAQGKSPPAAVRDFAEMMIRDHTASTDRLKAVLETDSSVRAPASPTLTAAQQTQLEQLRTATGVEFATLYMRQQVAAHEAALTTLTGFANAGTHAGLKQFAAQTAQAVRGHLEQARNLESPRGGAGTTNGTGDGRGAGTGSNNPNGPGTSPGNGGDSGTTGRPPVPPSNR